MDLIKEKNFLFFESCLDANTIYPTRREFDFSFSATATFLTIRFIFYNIRNYSIYFENSYIIHVEYTNFLS